jgi:ribonuclease Y
MYADILNALTADIYLSLALGAGFFIGFMLAVLYFKGTAARRKKDAEGKVRKLLQDAKTNAAALKKESELAAKDKIINAKAEVEKETRERRAELNQLDKRLRQREEMLDRKLEQFDKKEHNFDRREKDLQRKEKRIEENEQNLEKLIKNEKELLERYSGMSSEEAKRELFKKIEDESRFEATKIAKQIEDEAIESVNRKSKEVMSLAIQRYASDYVSDNTISAVNLPNDEMKGRIIGREGRNIRALEAATGVELIIDDTPESVLLSSFDPVRREIARVSLERLIADGRIHPARIEEVVEKARKEIDASIKEEGDQAVFDLGLHGIHHEIIKLIGRLKYRTSYAQNVLQHSREVAYLAGIMAGELQVDTKLAKRAGILHDIGKGVDHELEGSHQSIGANLAKKYGENNKIVNAIEVHHGDGDPITVEGTLVAAADALSAARPGARKEALESYLKRLEKLEEIATSFDGVNKCYAIQAGREIRIMVKPEDVSDEVSSQISRNLAKKIEEELTYPGQIKVTVIRESRYVKYAR